MKADPAVDLFFLGKVSDFFAFFNATGNTCLKDIVITFNADGTTKATNPPSCQGSEELTESIIADNGKWKLDNDKLTITDATGKVNTYDVTTNGDTMQWSFRDSLET